MNPNIDQSNNGNLKGVLDTYFKNQLLKSDGMLPCEVVSYSEGSKSVTVQIMMQMATTDGSVINRATISGVVVGTLSAGGFLIHVPIKAGDKGWIKANDCDISLYKQSLSLSKPNTIRIKSFSDGVFFPDMTKPYSPKHSGALNIQNVSGSVCISIHDDKVVIDAPKTEVNGDFEVNGSSQFNGGMTGNGNASFGGGSLTHNGKNVGDTHTHSGVQPGSSNTGEPA